jgi:hypothetical protein
VQRLTEGQQLIAWPPRGKDVYLELGRREVGPRWEVSHRPPGGDAVGEGHPYAAVHVPARVEVSLIDDEPPLDRVVVDLDDLDPEVSRE